MDPQIVFSYGLTKSGSTLAYQLVLVALERAGHPQPALRLPGVTVSRRINAIEHLDADAAARMRAAVAARPRMDSSHARWIVCGLCRNRSRPVARVKPGVWLGYVIVGPRQAKSRSPGETRDSA